MKNKEFVSRVKNAMNLLTKDMDVNGRFILHTGQRIAETYISLRLRDRSLYRQDNLYSQLECLEMEKVDTYTCDIIEFRSCKKLMRSVKKLPSLVYSRYGASIRELTSIDNEVELKPTTLKQYRRDTARSRKSDHDYYYMKDGHVYAPESEIEMINGDLITLDLYDLNQASSCRNNDCKSAWEYEFIVPSELVKQVIDETAQMILNKIQIPIDENNNLDSNQKSATI